MNNLKRIALIFVVIVLAISATGCAGFTNVVNIPAGYVGMLLTPTGWTGEWLEAGQVDLGLKNNNGTYNSLVLLEVTSTTVKEQFLAKGETVADGTVLTRDDRVLTQDSVPLSVDVYVRAMIPADNESRTAILAQVTPIHVEGDPAEVQRITVESIYKKFAQPETRSSVRTIFAGYKDYATVYQNYAGIPDTLGQRIATIFKANGVPLTLMSVSLSNVKPDEVVWESLNKKAAAQAEADAVNILGQAYKDNPGFQQWQSLIEMSKNDPNLLVVLNSGESSDSDALVKAMLQQMMKKTSEDATSTVTPTPTP
jgi:regulator of protease activity HflC (stomatin/prohibitin superfamily)